MPPAWTLAAAGGFDNPIVFIDPDGKTPRWYGQTSNEAVDYADQLGEEREDAEEEDEDDKVIIKDEDGDVCNENCEPSDNVQRLLNILNDELEGFNEVDITDSGELFITKTDKVGEASKFATNLAKYLEKLFADENTIELSISDQSSATLGGSFATGNLDLTDIEKYGKGPLESSASVIVHELAEQYEKQINGVSDFIPAHRTALEVQTSISGNKRLENRQINRGNRILIIPYETSNGVQYMRITIDLTNRSILEVKQ